MSETANQNVEAAGERGPVEHHRRAQLLEAADQHFRRYGYQKTTVADLARAVGVSPAYVYRFFDSKQAIGEAVCGRPWVASWRGCTKSSAKSVPRRSACDGCIRTLVQRGLDLFAERKLHDIVAAAIDGDWSSPMTSSVRLKEVVQRLVIAGREAGEFERKTPLDDLTNAISCTLLPFGHPILLEQTDRAELEGNAEQVAAMVLRSLAP